MATYERTVLGNYSSVVCFKAVITGMEDMLGEQATAISLKAAGRRRGASLAEGLGYRKGQASLADLPAVTEQLDHALGKDGTRLCRVERIDADGDAIRVYTSETVCSAGEELGSSRTCTFTLGAVHGALEYLLDTQYTATHTESVLRGASHDVFELVPR